MGLETTTFLDGLNTAWPLGTDPGPQGDDHLRLIKSVLKDTFPGSGGNGFSKQILATEDEINHLTGLTVDIATALAGATFPTGTILPFYNAAPPPGWTIVTQTDTFMLTVGSGAYSTGGTDNPLLNNKVPSHIHSASGATTDSAGNHSHTLTPTAIAEVIVGGPGNIFGGTGNVQASTMSMGTAGAHTHDLTGVIVAANAGAADWTPKYLGLILCSKN
jgi:hypothetical protein